MLKLAARTTRLSGVQASLLRCNLGNPFRPPPLLDTTVLAWNGGTVGTVCPFDLRRARFGRPAHSG